MERGNPQEKFHRHLGPEYTGEQESGRRQTSVLMHRVSPAQRTRQREGACISGYILLYFTCYLILLIFGECRQIPVLKGKFLTLRVQTAEN